MTGKRETSHSNACKKAAHYWILNDENLGICKKCGAQKQFPVDVFGWRGRNIMVGKAVHKPAA